MLFILLFTLIFIELYLFVSLHSFRTAIKPVTGLEPTSLSPHNYLLLKDTSGSGKDEIETVEYEGIKLTPIRQQPIACLAGTRFIDKEKYRLCITGMVNRSLSLTYNDLLNYPQVSKVLRLDCVDGWNFNAKVTGPYLQSILKDAGVKPEAKIAVFRTADVTDGYTSLELSYICEHNIILAMKINDVTIPPEKGFPFQVIAEGKYGYKWAKWVTVIELTSDEQFRGFWEKRGYNNMANANGPVFET